MAAVALVAGLLLADYLFHRPTDVAENHDAANSIALLFPRVGGIGDELPRPFEIPSHNSPELQEVKVEVEVPQRLPADVPTIVPVRRLGDARYRGPVVAGALSISANGALAAFGKREIMIWDVAANRPHRQWKHTNSSDGPFALSPDGQRFFANSDFPYDLFVWDVPTGKMLRERKETFQWALFAEGRRLLTVDVEIEIDPFFSRDDTEPRPRKPTILAIWDTQTWKLLRHFAYDNLEPGPLGISPDGSRFVYEQNGALAAFDGETGKPIWQTTPPGEALQSYNRGLAIAWSADSKFVAIATINTNPEMQIAYVLDIASGKLVKTFDRVTPAPGMSFTPDGKFLLIGAEMIEVSSGNRRDVSGGFRATGMAMHADGKTIVLGGSSPDDECGLRVVDIASGETRFPPKLNPVEQPFPTADPFPGRISYTRVYPIVFRLTDGRSIWFQPNRSLSVSKKNGAAWTNKSGAIFAYAATRDGETLITRGTPAPDPNERKFRDDPRTRFWDIETEREWGSIDGIDYRNYSTRRMLALSADDRTLATMQPDGSIWLWEVSTLKPRLRLDPMDREEITYFTFSQDGRHVMSHGSYKLTGLVWKLDRAPAKLTENERDSAWSDLIGRDASLAYAAIWRFAADPDAAVPFLAGKVKTEKPADTAALSQRPFDHSVVVARRIVETFERIGSMEAVASLRTLAKGEQRQFAGPASAAISRMDSKSPQK